jgi:hypothetical protein
MLHAAAFKLHFFMQKYQILQVIFVLCRCVACQLSFAAAEKVRQIGDSFFHSRCFRCHRCAQDLTAADRVGCDVNGNILCELDFLSHYDTAHEYSSNPQQQQQHCENSSDMSGMDDTVDNDNDNDEGDEAKDKAVDDWDDRDELANDDEDGKDGGGGKRKRGPKTTIKPPQLEILKTCFDQNPKPSPKIFGELAQDTGLTKRVIQVKNNNNCLNIFKK